jgi:hypothetical protein
MIDGIGPSVDQNLAEGGIVAQQAIISYKQLAKCEISLHNDHFHETFRNAMEQRIL